MAWAMSAPRGRMGGWGPSDRTLCVARRCEQAFDTLPRTPVRCQGSKRTIVCTNRCLTRPPNVSTLPPCPTSSPPPAAPSPPAAPAATNLTSRQREILEVIDRYMRERGYPPSVREIGEAVGPHVAVHRPQPPGHPPAPRATCGATPPSRGPSRSAATRPPAPRWSAGRSAHVPLVGDVAAGTDVLAQENVEELLPLPADFTGDGDLFMLRVRGDSMIEAGILDGDYVVARAPADGRQRRHRRGRHPRRGGHGQDLSRQGRQDRRSSRPTPGWSRWCSTPTTSRSTARSSPCCGGSDGGAPAGGGQRDAARARAAGLRARARPCAGGRRARGRSRSIGSRSTRSSAVWARVGSPGPKLAAGMPCGGEAGDVGPAELGPDGQAVARRQRRQQRVVERRAAPSARQSTTSTSSPASTARCAAASARGPRPRRACGRGRSGG